jgi:hypothetical protein
MNKPFNLNDLLYTNLPFTINVIAGLIVTLSGLVMNVYNRQSLKGFREKGRLIDKRLLAVINRIASFTPLKFIRNNIKSSLSFCIMEESSLNLISGILAITISVLSIALIILLYGVGQLWYVKFLILAMSLVLPYYAATLLLDLYKYHVSKQIPKMVDEFRSAFIKHNKIKPALKECSLYIDRSMGRIISRAADSTLIEDTLNALSNRFKNIWFNIFVTLILNFKENGGELIDQLYRLNRTMARYSGIEKKKNKRLIWYEMFTVATSVFSIPAIFWLNDIILGNEGSMILDAQSNILISQVIGFSILSLVIIRILRKM